eukprot:362063-Chlamydomonas_euryale.AAC.4
MRRAAGPPRRARGTACGVPARARTRPAERGPTQSQNNFSARKVRAAAFEEAQGMSGPTIEKQITRKVRPIRAQGRSCGAAAKGQAAVGRRRKHDLPAWPVLPSRLPGRTIEERSYGSCQSPHVHAAPNVRHAAAGCSVYHATMIAMYSRHRRHSVRQRPHWLCVPKCHIS